MQKCSPVLSELPDPYLASRPIRAISSPSQKNSHTNSLFLPFLVVA